MASKKLRFNNGSRARMLVLRWLWRDKKNGRGRVKEMKETRGLVDPRRRSEL